MVKKEPVIVVTEDKALRIGSKNIHENDMAILNPQPSRGRKLTVEDFEKMARQGSEKFSRYLLMVAMKMTPQRAKRIRDLRVNEVWSWRAIAAISHREWGLDADWDPPSNQIAGMALCQIAAETFGEHYRSAPWN
jgi:hypothetical protein